jgi:NACalpha-BTF3-like transcription factor
MKSKWSHVRTDAESMRRNGKSLKAIHKKLGIPLSTLSGWMKHIELNDDQKNVLAESSEVSLIRARLKASEWHRSQKQVRITKARMAAQTTLDTIDNNLTSLEIALAFLYLGEGGKTERGLRMGNSNATILNLYLYALENLYGLKRSSFNYSIHMRYDQDENVLREFWSKILTVPISKFNYVVKDSRTIGRPTYIGYNGVCLISGGSVEIQRKLMYLAEAFCERILRG